MSRELKSPRASQRGYMLLLVLVALVAMMVSGIALVRSMDTNQLVAGNMAARNSTVHSADVAVQLAAAWLTANANNGVLWADAPTNGYWAEKPAKEPDWTAAATWTQCTTTIGATPCITTDATGNQVSWVIHRMCTSAGSPANQFCSSATSTGAGSAGKSYSTSAATYLGASTNFYRITIQVVGPRNTTTLSQAFVTM